MKPKRYTNKGNYRYMSLKEVRDDIRNQWQGDLVKHAAIQERAERHEIADGRMKTFIRCCDCDELFGRNQIEAHHINPVGPLVSTRKEDIENFLKKMFCKKAEIQPLCKCCHGRKTATQQNQKTKGAQCPQLAIAQ